MVLKLLIYSRKCTSFVNPDGTEVVNIFVLEAKRFEIMVSNLAVGSVNVSYILGAILFSF